jgi:imidazolonepropionase-like amidohydrolase
MRTLLTAPRVIPGDGSVIDDGAVLVERDHILAVGPAAEIGHPLWPYTHYHIADGTILPGLIDAHTHLTCSASEQMVQDALTDDDFTLLLRAVEHARAALRAGITTIRDCGSRHNVALKLRQAIQNGIVQGPRILLCGNLLTTCGGHLSFFGREVDTPEDIPRAVREQVKAGADFIKVTGTGGGLLPGNSIIYRQFDGEALTAIVREAAELGVHVGVHTLSPQGVRDVIQARPRTVEHLTFYVDTHETVEYDGALIDQLVELEIWGSQLIIGWHRRAYGARGVLCEDLGDLMYAKLEERITVLQDMHTRGLRTLAGSDAGMPLTYFDNFGLILDLSVRNIGMTPLEAIRSATSDAALAFGLSDRGRIQPGLLADLAVLDGDPRIRSEVFYDVALTMLGGRVVWNRVRGVDIDRRPPDRHDGHAPAACVQ